ncbi:hypothetical protein [Pseudomonas sp. SWI44]|uniref:hypothetical protein n=1 Tax=Pseudomonas sp. SWI44 TaxID=2083053 RepID=UPI000CE5E836|nr:hypothetical protein [Pseudomonas sp. SWI44]AVD90397.1 hypothetical protein C4Q26_26060 [Pseudomonas sp. SWI44]
MSEEMESSPIAVSACVEQWLDGPYGKYARAKVLTPGSSVSEAIYSPKALKCQPELSVPFDCKIQFSKGRWRVVEISKSAKPVEVELTGIVESDSAIGGQRSWRIKLAPGQPGAAYAALDSKVLRAARFAHVEPSQELTFLALPSEADWTVTEILEPTLSTVITDPLIAFHAFSLRDWSSNDSVKSVPFAVRLPGVSIWPLVNVFTTLLRRQSIPSLMSVDLSDPSALSRAEHYIEHAQTVLREGSPQEVDCLKIGCIEVTLVWNARGFWNTQKLVAPIPMREPTPKEAIDWVECTVVAVDDLDESESIEVDAEPLENDEIAHQDAPPGSDSSKKKIQKVKVTIEIKDRRIGRGNVSGFLKCEEIVYGGLTKGTKAIVQLVGNPPYWNVSRLHRSLPMRGEA